MVIAGISQSQIVQILRRDEAQALACQRLVLSPVQSSFLLRPYLYFTKRWHIVAEDIVREQERYYEVICIERGAEDKVSDDIDLFLGPLNVSRPHPLLQDYLDYCHATYLKNWPQMLKRVQTDRSLYFAFLRAVSRANRQLRLPFSTQPSSSPMQSGEEKEEEADMLYVS